MLAKRCVYLDPIDGKGSMKRGVSMNTGKVDPRAVVADGKIFVLSSSIAVDFTLPCYNEKGMPVDNSIRFFECFDPESDKWMVLDDPPIDIPIWWHFSFVGGRFIFFVGSDRDNFRVLSVFNLDTLEWTSSTKLEKEKITADDLLIFTAFGEHSSDKYLYGLHGLINKRILRTIQLVTVLKWLNLAGEKHESMKRKQEDSWKHESMKRNKKITGIMRA
ncbi:hypothetical protein GH714_000454 [Hevea brasiliensis]|uniref:Uncharacterized protein n=1 Tax=Hevea brasiliensis TaxID=3981 RepID=A0A6A6ML96_HEVBR|nr:hypothetical protein GH714_000454 [Hevea brasiliensis]